MGTVSSAPQKGDLTQICTNAAASDFLAGRSHCWLWLGLLKLRFNSMRVSVLPAGRHLLRLAEVWGPGACLSLTTLIGEGHPLYSAWQQLGSHQPSHHARSAPVAGLCLSLRSCRQVPSSRAGFFPWGQRGGALPRFCQEAPSLGPGFFREQLSAGRTGGLALWNGWSWSWPVA